MGSGVFELEIPLSLGIEIRRSALWHSILCKLELIHESRLSEYGIFSLIISQHCLDLSNSSFVKKMELLFELEST